jgi:hypothetical protein
MRGALTHAIHPTPLAQLTAAPAFVAAAAAPLAGARSLASSAPRPAAGADLTSEIEHATGVER